MFFLLLVVITLSMLFYIYSLEFFTSALADGFSRESE